MELISYNRFYGSNIMKLIKSSKLEFGVNRNNKNISEFSKKFLKKCLKV